MTASPTNIARPCLISAAVFLASLSLPLAAQDRPAAEYVIDVERVYSAVREHNGKNALYITAEFKVRQADREAPLTEVDPNDHIVVEEDRRPVADLELYQPRAAALTTVLVMDTSGSMARHRKIAEARRAGEAFLDKLDPRAGCGLILFDHEMRVVEPPLLDFRKSSFHRDRLRRMVRAAHPRGGTAYLDATARAVEMLHDVPGRRAVVLMTDGIDINSKIPLARVVKMAQGANTPVYTLGVGDPGKQEPVTTVLVLDHSGSMAAPADDQDRISKIQALQRAAGRFIDIMRPGAETTLAPFSSRVEKPAPFFSDKQALKEQIESLEPEGGTRLYDATYAAVETLNAARRQGKQAVIVLTDGMDENPGSRHRLEEVVARARASRIPLYMLGLGRPHELNEEAMRIMAEQTGGSYHRAGNEQQLIETFENLSIQLHDDGIDESDLTALAEQTGGKYRHVRNASDLQGIYQELAEELQSTFTATFPSRRSSHDGTARGIDINILRNGVRISSGGRADYSVHGVVVPDMDYRVYLVFLSILSVLLLLPAGVRRLFRFYGG